MGSEARVELFFLMHDCLQIDYRHGRGSGEINICTCVKLFVQRYVGFHMHLAADGVLDNAIVLFMQARQVSTWSLMLHCVVQ